MTNRVKHACFEIAGWVLGIGAGLILSLAIHLLSTGHIKSGLIEIGCAVWPACMSAISFINAAKKEVI